MTKKSGKGKRKKKTTNKQRRQGLKYWQHKLSGWWQRRRKIVIMAGSLVAFIVLVVGMFALIERRTDLAAKKTHLTRARNYFHLGKYKNAIIEYHQALNADRHDKQLAREEVMVRNRINSGGSVSVANAIAAAEVVLAYDSSSVIANTVLAALHNQISDLENLYKYAHEGRILAKAANDSAALFSATQNLGSYFRQREEFDSSVIFDSRALELAQTIGDTLNIETARVGVAYSYLNLGRLEQARQLLDKVVINVGVNRPGLRYVAMLGIADYFWRNAKLDSVECYAALVEDSAGSDIANPTSAFAIELQARVLLKKGQTEQAIDRYNQALKKWRIIRGQSHIIDILNDLAQVYYELSDLATARSYYIAAGKLASNYDFKEKDRYTVNLNLRFLKRIPTKEYMASGERGDSIYSAILADIES